MPAAEPDFYPLRVGLALEYRTKTLAGSGLLRVEVVSVKPKGPGLEAVCRRTSVWDGKTETGRFTVVKAPDGVTSGSELEFPRPALLGRRWSRPPVDFEIDSLDARAEVPAGVFRHCLRVAYRIAGGDAGQGERLYAPGVGLVKELCADETDPYETQLEKIL